MDLVLTRQAIYSIGLDEHRCLFEGKLLSSSRGIKVSFAMPDLS